MKKIITILILFSPLLVKAQTFQNKYGNYYYRDTFQVKVLQAINPVGVSYGGTGASTASTARTNLGATTVGSNLFTLSNPGAVRFLKINADNTVTARTAAEMLSDIGAAASGSTITFSQVLGTIVTTQ